MRFNGFVNGYKILEVITVPVDETTWGGGKTQAVWSNGK